MISGLETVSAMNRQSAPERDLRDPQEAEPLLLEEHVGISGSAVSQLGRTYGIKCSTNEQRRAESSRSWYRKQSIYSTPDKNDRTLPSTSPIARRRRAFLHLHYMLLALVIYGLWIVSRLRVQASDVESAAALQSSVARDWGAYSPYEPVRPYSPVPSGCSINQVNIIQRHGARYPTEGASERIVKALAKLKNAKEYTDASLDFLKNYTYTLGVSDLIPYGARQSRAAGATVFQRYSNLVSDSYIPFIRVSDGRRVVDTAKNWTAGFSVASKYKYQPRINVFISELDDRNNTLDDIMCPNAGGPDDYTDAWSQVFATPIADRLNSHAPGANLDPLEIYNLMALCAFETLVNGKESHFCPLFTKSEFDQFEYFYDLDKYYGTGYGQELGPVQGVGYVNELLARLTRSPVRDETQTNRTLTGSPLTFPLDRTIYADFSHDNQMIAIFSALGLFKQPQDLDPRNPDPKRTWIISHLTPFNGMMVTERLQCKSKTRSGTYVRILVNDALQPLEFCGADKIGLCDLDSFVRSQAYARENGRGDFEKCFD